jgi:tetratricopeptide (TPR) repeat protein
MSAYQRALQAEAAGHIPQALTWYEQAILLPDAPLAAFTNLAFLYWLLSYDFGVQTAFVHAHADAEAVLQRAATRWPSLLTAACQRFAHEPEPRYWQAYFTEQDTYADLPDPFLLVEMPACWPTFLLPQLYRFQHGLPCYQPAVDQLYEQVCHEQTHKSQWITNTVDSLRRFTT